MIYIDTNVLVRFFTKDIPRQALYAKRLLDSKKALRVIDVIFPELEYVLGRVYHVDRPSVIASYKFLMSHPTIHVSALAKKALSLYETSTLEMTDCFIFVSCGIRTLASFDRKLLRMPGVRPYWKKKGELSREVISVTLL